MIPSLFLWKFASPEQYRKPGRKKSRPAFRATTQKPQSVQAPVPKGQSGLHARRKITGESINCADWEHVPDMAAAMPRAWSSRNLNHLLTLTKSVGMKFATPQVTDVRMDMMSQKRTWRTML